MPRQEIKTEEKRLEEERERGLRYTDSSKEFISEPTYHFSAGEQVICGHLDNCIIQEIFDDGKRYGFLCQSKRRNEIHKEYHVVPWYDLRPMKYGDTHFAEKHVRIYFSNRPISGLIHLYHHMGIDMDPFYQRGYVWTDEDREALITSIFAGADIGKFALVETEKVSGPLYEILDGKQRLRTIIDFYENRFPYKGKYYNDLSIEDRAAFEDLFIPVALIPETDRKTVLRYFLFLNRSGRHMDKEHLDQVEKMYMEM